MSRVVDSTASPPTHTLKANTFHQSFSIFAQSAMYMYKRRGIHVTIFSQFLISSNYLSSVSFFFALAAFSPTAQ